MITYLSEKTSILKGLTNRAKLTKEAVKQKNCHSDSMYAHITEQLINI